MGEKTGSALDRVLYYHERTKHHTHRYARSLGYMDWSVQPSPFRQYRGAPFLRLDHIDEIEPPLYDALFEAKGAPVEPLGGTSIGRLFQQSLALSAWKQVPGGALWPLRVNPSSGNLHPTEGYLIAGPMEGLSGEAAVYHYSPLAHGLEERMRLDGREWDELSRQLPSGAVIVALTSIYWRESWKYGERAFRYCHHDVGHALGAVNFAAATLGWQARLVDSVGDEDLAVLLGVRGQKGMEAEHPDALVAIFPREGIPGNRDISLTLPDSLLDRLSTAAHQGEPNRLSFSHHAWPVIDDAALAARFPGGGRGEEYEGVPMASTLIPDRGVPAQRIIHQRRSAVAMDGETSLSRESFYHMMARVTPSRNAFPFDVLTWRPRVSLAIFVHRVSGLDPGLYMLVRDPALFDSLKGMMKKDFLWKKPEGCPDGLGLYLLLAGDFQDAAQRICCHQEIASGSAFSLGMLAEFEPVLEEKGSWFYPRLFWETGLIGQVLYLEAEAAGVRATGIGCFFDDAMHELLGVTDRARQSLYHFTVGGPLEDKRLRTLHPYHHLAQSEM